MSNLTSHDTLRGYDLKIRQPDRGYRFSLDALLLAGFARVCEKAIIADLGTGCGVIPLVLARMHHDACFVGVERNPDMAALAVENACSNGLDTRIEILSNDILTIRSHFPVSSFDFVVSNPPFRTAGSGKVSPHPGRDVARHETTAGLADFMAAAKYLVKPGGRICFIYHPSRLVEFICRASELKLVLTRLRMVHGTSGAEAKMFLAELAKGRRADVVVEAPLVIYGSTGEYTLEAAEMMGVKNHKELAGSTCQLFE
jgi:tRNA1Val (adenine37-N6)-methyltransferase